MLGTYNRAGEPIDIDEWMRLRLDPGYPYVKRTEVDDGYVSTVWYGMDITDDNMWMFETGIFLECGSRIIHYRDEKTALSEHDIVVIALNDPKLGPLFRDWLQREGDS